jgi:hypothetical protein
VLSRRTTSVLTFFDFFVSASLVIAAPLVIAASLLIAAFLVIGPFLLVQSLFLVRAMPICVLAGISGRARRAWLSLRARGALYGGSCWRRRAPGNK